MALWYTELRIGSRAGNPAKVGTAGSQFLRSYERAEEWERLLMVPGA